MGKQAMQAAIKGHNVVDAMHRKGLGWIDFFQGAPGDGPPDFEHGGGIAHIRAKRDYENSQDNQKPGGEETLMSLPEVIAKGKLMPSRGRDKVTIEHAGFIVVLNRAPASRTNPVQHWLLTGFKKGRSR